MKKSAIMDTYKIVVGKGEDMARNRALESNPLPNSLKDVINTSKDNSSSRNTSFRWSIKGSSSNTSGGYKKSASKKGSIRRKSRSRH